MPGQDKTGPQGQGQQTGRGRGQCSSRNQSENNSRGRRFGGRPGSGRGFGRGAGFMRGPNQQMVSSEKDDLKLHIADLESELQEAKKTLNEVVAAKDDSDEK